MTTIAKPDDLATMFADVDRRLRALEGSSQQAYSLRVADSVNPAITRVEAGHLKAIGSSPAQDGFRILDANGVPISDSSGLIYAQRVVDNSSVTRVEVGNMPARGLSPAQIGLRVNDASGTPIFDSIGLFGVMSLLANYDTILPVSGTTADINTFTDVPGSQLNFNLARQQTVLLLGSASCMSNPNKFGKLRFVTDSAYVSTYLLWSAAGAALTGFAPGTLFQVITLPGGAHNTKWQWATTATGVGNLNVNTASLYAFLLGG